MFHGRKAQPERKIDEAAWMGPLEEGMGDGRAAGTDRDRHEWMCVAAGNRNPARYRRARHAHGRSGGIGQSVGRRHGGYPRRQP
ncbi:hypothetical protein DESC_740183 [Desulfosarcina cetonica]|nr:hypothetical protein DESC_740183 [Desulfosarcina cetonica]